MTISRILRRERAILIALGLLFLITFTANALSHDYFCHDELHTICSPLHLSFLNMSPSPAQFALPAALMIGNLCLPDDQDIIAGFTGNVFHPPL
jgi:hypothetical protein